MKQKKISKNDNKLLALFLYNNCFSDGDKTHLGFRFRGVYYCITHSKVNGYEIPKKYLRMKDISDKPEYLKVCESMPVIVNPTGMKISKDFVLKYLSNKDKINKNDTNNI